MKKFLALILALLMVLSLAACGASKEDTQDAESSQQEESSSQTAAGSSSEQTQEDPDPVAEDNGADDYQFDVKEDDHTVVISTDSVIMVFTHDGENVTGYTGYVDCGSAAAAKAKVDEVNNAAAFKEEEGIKSVTAKGKYAVIEYTQEAFAVTTYEELHELAELYGQVNHQ